MARILTDDSSNSRRRAASFIHTCGGEHEHCCKWLRVVHSTTHRSKEAVEHEYGDGLHGSGHRNGNAKSRPEANQVVERSGDNYSTREIERHAGHPRNQDQEALQMHR